MHSFLLIAFAFTNIFISPYIERPAHMVVINAVILLPLVYLVTFGSKFDHRSMFVNLAIFGTPVIGLLFTTLFLIDPLLADKLGREDFVIEYATAAFSVLASFILLGIAVFFAFKKDTVAAIIAFALSLGFFVIGMEEISWMQRILNIDTPEYFLQSNIQKEINFHNLNTALTMVLFFFVIFLVFVIIPFFDNHVIKLLKRLKLSAAKIFIPSKWLALPILMSLAFASSSYSTKLHHIIMVIFTVLIISNYLFIPLKEFEKIRLPLYVSLLVFAFSALSLGLQDPAALGIRSWAISEYREFLACFTIFLYSVDLSLKVKDSGK